MTLRWESLVGSRPESTIFIGSGTDLAVTVYDEDMVIILDGETGKIKNRIQVPDEPYGIISNASGTRLYVSHEYPGKVSEIDPKEAKVIRVMNAGSRPRGIALHPSEKTIYVSEFLTAAMHAIDIEKGELFDSWKGQPSDNLARHLSIHPKRPKAYVPHIRSRTTVIDGTGSIFPQFTIWYRPPKESGANRLEWTHSTASMWSPILGKPHSPQMAGNYLPFIREPMI
jgi:DNA-binding beta-propeller fold protein YncE